MGAAAWIADFMEETSYFWRTSSGSFSMRTNMVGTHWLILALYFSMSFSACFGVEMLHHHDGAAEPLHGHAIAQGGGVIERRRRQIDRILVGAEQHGDKADQRRWPHRSARRDSGWRTPLGRPVVPEE